MFPPKNSPPQKNPPKASAAPSLVILTPDDVLTKFQRRRFNPDEFMNVFDRFKTNPFGPGGLSDSKSRGYYTEDDGFTGDMKSGYGKNGKGQNSRQGNWGKNGKNGKYGDGIDPNLRERGIIDLASLGSDFDINKALLNRNGDGDDPYGDDFGNSVSGYGANGGNGFGNGKGDGFGSGQNGYPFGLNPNDPSFDLRSNATSAFSVYPGDEELFKKLQRQLNFGLFGDLFPHEFDDMDIHQKRQLGRVARLQTAQKRNWYNGIWQLFDLLDDPNSTDHLWQTLKLFMKPDGEDENTNKNNNGNNNQNHNDDGKENINKFQNKKKRFRDGIELPSDDDDDGNSNRSKKKMRNKNQDDYSELDSITNDPVAKSLMKSAKKIFESFLIYDKGGLNLFMRASIIGPLKSGKSVFFRSFLIHVLNFLVEGDRFKSFFIVPLDFSKKKIKTPAQYYNYVSSTVIEALLVQRTDLHLFQNSLRKAFSSLTTASHMKHLPKPISSQDYLRGSMKQVDILLSTLHRCYNEPTLMEAFLTNVSVLPQTIGDIFCFDTTYQIIDHIDLIDIDIKRKGFVDIPLFEYVKFGLSQTQYLISCVHEDHFQELMSAYDLSSVDLRFNTQTISIFDICKPVHLNDIIKVEFKKDVIPPILKIGVEHCGGCPGFICLFDQVCYSFLTMREEYSPTSKMEKKLRLIQACEDLIHTLFNCKEVPEIEDVKLIDNLEEEEEDAKEEDK
ncbi:hypothetical protein TRFO_29135 [Tritrichomonas foetus]|uniref:Uncharacterized protein n=1 Tax=Tritrichomonas foetus TaxID=1144522 RepID=A0A1J4K155_9EUKA|nr:hypothetical protein TRFO_29135 [Tritrichomonas foetus]|eukprot:OHT03476.1 hypothetical protein TRFO_29135 [Tritrichomonas foetus]